MKRTFGGMPHGQGATYEWDGNKEIGQGRMEITEATAPSRITIALDFLRPFRAHNVAEFSLEARGETTHVTWGMRGASPYVAKVLSVFINIDRMVGRDFETGLANLKAIAEK